MTLCAADRRTHVRQIILATTATILLGACQSLVQRGVPASRITAPASALNIGALTPDARTEWTFYRRRSSDTADEPIAHLETEERSSATDNTLTLIMHWLPPFESSDSLVVDRATLAPREESSRSGPLAFQYRYQADRVTGTIRKADSLARPVADALGERVYAFNELDQLARSLPFRSGTRVVVPLYSEADADVEHDTLAVLGDTVVDGASAWIVRFADPVIVRRYLIESPKRQVLESDITQRRSGTRFRLVPLRQPAHLETAKSAAAERRYRLVPTGRTTADTTHWTVVQRTGPSERTTLQVMISTRRASASVDSVLFDSRTMIPYWERLYGRDTIIVAFANDRASGWRSTNDSGHVAINVPTPGFVYVSTMGDRDRASRRILRHVYRWRRDGTTSEVIAAPRGD